MKKWLPVIILLTAVLFVYFFIPNIVSISKQAVITNNYRGVYRELTDSTKWHNWWLAKENKGSVQLNGNRYFIKSITASSVLVDIQTPDYTVASSIFLVPDEYRNVQVNWAAAVPTSYNPIKRIQRYFSASSLSDDIGKLLQSMEKFYADTANVYGVKINRDIVKDSLLIFTYDSIKGNPSQEKIYSMIDELRNYINAYSAKATDSPMLNIYTADSVWFLTKVAIPTNKRLPSLGKISFKWMLGNGNILTADVEGDENKVNTAFKGVDNYVNDFELASPAIPFYKLITNRLAEKDSAKWKTRIYYPVMYYKD